MPTIDEIRRQRRQQQPIQPAAVASLPQEEDNTAPNAKFQVPETHYDTPEWEAARKNPELIQSIRRYAKNVDNEDFSSDDQAFEWFVGDRRWKDSNVFSTLKELNYVKGGFGSKYASEQDLKDLSVIRDHWEKLPGGLSRIAQGDFVEGAGAIIENIAKGIVDPSILLGGLGGKAVGSVVKKGAGAVSQQALKRTLQTGTAIATDAAITAGSNLAYQEVNKDAGLQDQVDGWEALKAGGIGAVLSAPGHLSAFKPKSGQIVNDPTAAAEQAIRASKDLREKGIKDLFGGAQKLTPDGHKLSVGDIDLAKDMNSSSSVDGLENMSYDDFVKSAERGVVGPAEGNRPNFTRKQREKIDVRGSSDEINQLIRDVNAKKVPLTDEVKAKIEAHRKDTGLVVAHDQGLNLGYETDDIAHFMVHTWAMENMPEYRDANIRSAQAPKGTAPRPPLPKEAFEPAYKEMQRQFKKHTGPEPTYVDLMGYDPVNIVNLSNENLAFAKAMANTIPSWNNNPKNVLDFLETNNKRLIEFKAEHFPKVEDEVDFERMASEFQKQFPELFQEQRRGTVSDATAEKGALKMMEGKNTEQLAKGLIDTPVGTALNAEQTTAARYIVNMLYDDVHNTAQRALKDPNWNPTAQEMADAERKWELLGMATAKYAGVRSEAGRTLRAPQTSEGRFNKFLQKTGKAINMATGTDLSVEARKDLIKDLGKAMSMLDRGDQLQLDLFVANMHQNKGNWGDVFYEMYYNWGLLSNPSTSAINILGNMTSTALENVERGIAAGLTPGERMPYLDRLAGYATAQWDAMKLGWKTYQTELPSDPQTRLESVDKHAIPSWRITADGFKKAGVGEGGFVIGGRQARIPGRLLLGVDEYTKALHQRAYIYGEASKAAGNLKGSARKKAIADFMAKPPEEVMQGALEEARRLTYTDKLGPGLRGFQQFIDDLPGGRVIIPFVRTPAKIIQQAADMLYPTERTAADFAKGGFDRKRAIARVGMGYSMLGVGAVLAYNGYATGSAPSDPNARRMFEANNMLPWAVRSDNNWIQINRWDPVAIPFTVGVGLEKTFESFAASGTGAEREDQFLSTMAAFLSDAILDKSFFQGVENVVGAVMEPERKLEAFGKGVVRSFVPAIAAGYARAADPRTTAPLTFWEVIQDRVGFDARKKVPTKIDGFGREVANEVPLSYKGQESAVDFVNRFVNPFKAKSGANDPVSNELYELGIKLSPERKKYKDVELDSYQKYVYNKAEGRVLYDSLRFAMNQPNWSRLPKESRRMIIEKYKEYAGKAGQMMLLGAYPELLRQSVVENNDVKKLTAPTRSQIKESLKFDPKR